MAYIDIKKNRKKFSINYIDVSIEDSDDIISNDIAMATSHVSNQLSKSMIFQHMFLSNIKNSELLKKVLDRFNFYAVTNLFVIGMRETSLISALDNLALNI